MYQAVLSAYDGVNEVERLTLYKCQDRLAVETQLEKAGEHPGFIKLRDELRERQPSATIVTRMIYPPNEGNHE